jgi:Arc/MetJ family transcription regulator
MRTNVVLDDKLIETALQYTGLKTKKELIDYALRELVRRQKQKSVLQLAGKLHWDGNLREMRKDRCGNSR